MNSTPTETTERAAAVPVRSAVAKQRQPQPLKARLRRQTAIVGRWLHIYLSMVAFAITLFFAVTGYTLNHAEWFASEQRTSERSGVMPHGWLRPAAGEPAKLEIVELLRNAEKVHGAVSDFRVDDQQISVSFKAPGYTADAFIDRDKNTYSLTITANGLVAVLNDLHKGRDTGDPWKWLIDASAILLTLVSLTGLLLILFLYKKRTSGLLWAAAGAVVCYLIYLKFVP